MSDPVVTVPAIALDLERAAAAVSIEPHELQEVIEAGHIAAFEVNGKVLVSVVALQGWAGRMGQYKRGPR